MNDEEWDSAIGAALFAEITRIVGDERAEEGGDNISYALPLSTPEQLLTLLCGAPSGVGSEGLCRYLEVQFPWLGELRANGKK